MTLLVGLCGALLGAAGGLLGLFLTWRRALLATRGRSAWALGLYPVATALPALGVLGAARLSIASGFFAAVALVLTRAVVLRRVGATP